MKHRVFIALLAALSTSAAQAAPATGAIWPTPADAGPSHLDLAAQLNLTFEAAPTVFKILRDDFVSATVRDLTRGLPPLTVGLVQDGSRLIPDSARPQILKGAAFEWIVGPGRIWRSSAAGDTAVIPVALQERNANCTHNGHLMLTFDQAGAPTSARVRIGGETCLPLQFDGEWTGTARRVTKDRSDFAPVLQRDRESRSAQLPVRTLDQLAVDVPGLDLRWLQQAAGDRQAVYGLVSGGVNYAAPCLTRLGEDVECAARALPSYSTAKSLFAGLGLMRLERLYPGSARLKVADLVTDCPGKGWDEVALIHLLDMASGHYRSADYEADEGALETFPFFDAETRDAKLSFACSANLHDQVDAINLTREQQDLIRKVPDADLRETVRDFMVNQRFRKDYWVKGPRRLSALAQVEALRQLRVVLVSPRDKIELTVKGATGDAQLSEKVYRPVLDALAKHLPRTLAELHSDGESGCCWWLCCCIQDH